MKKMNSKLFESLKLNENEAKNVNGGLAYTSKDTDTAASTTSYDIAFWTTDVAGKNGHWDTENTGGGEKDQPQV